MASLLEKATNIIKKLGETPKTENTKAETTSTSSNGDWIGSGGKSSPGGTTKKSELDYGTYKDDLDRLTKAQKEYQAAELRKARDSALNSLTAQEQEIKPAYQNARNQTSAASQTGARSFQEYLANRGLTNSGASAQAEINRQSALQNNLGNINTAEANAYRDIANQRTQVNTNYANGLASANAAIQQQYLNNLLNYNEQQRQYINNLKEQALGRYANDYYAEYLNYINNGGNPNDMYALQLLARSGAKQQNLTNNAISNGANLVANGIINYNTAGGAGMTIPEATAYSNDLKARAEAQAQLEAEQRAWDRYEAETKLNNDTMKARAYVGNINSQIANRGATGNNNQIINNSTQRKIIEHNFVTKDEWGDTVEDKQGIANYITSELYDGTMSTLDAKAFAKEYGLNYYQLTPEYQIIMGYMENKASGDEGRAVLDAFIKDNPSLDEGIIEQLRKDWEEPYK